MTTRKDVDGLKFLVVKSIHFVISILSFYVFFLLFRYGKISEMNTYGFRYHYFATLGYGVLLYFFNRTYNSYLFGYERIRALVFGQILSQVFSLILICFMISLGWGYFHNPCVFLGLLLLQFAFDCIWSYNGNKYYYKLHGKLKTLLIYRNQIDKRRFGSIRGKPTERMYEIADEVQYDGSFLDLKDRIVGYDAIFVAGLNSSCRNGILKYCEENDIPGFFLPHVGDTIMQSAKHVQVFDSSILYVNRKRLEPENAII